LLFPYVDRPFHPDERHLILTILPVDLHLTPTDHRHPLQPAPSVRAPARCPTAPANAATSSTAAATVHGAATAPRSGQGGNTDRSSPNGSRSPVASQAAAAPKAPVRAAVSTTPP